MIIGDMKNLEKPFLHSLKSQDIIDRFQAIRSNIPKDNFVAYYDTEQFLLPNEF